MRIAMTLALVAGLLVAVDKAQACRAYMTPEWQVQQLLAHQPKPDAVVRVEVTAVSTLGPHGWQATGRVNRVLSGTAKTTTFLFGERELVMTSCGRLFQPAQVGEQWVLYLVRSGEARTISRFLPAELVWASVVPGDIDLPQKRPARAEGLKPTPRLTPPR